MQTVITIILFVSGSLLMAIYFDKRIEETFGLNVMLCMLILYTFYCMDLLRAGLLIVCAISAAMWVFGLIKTGMVSRNNPRELARIGRLLFTPGFFIFIAVLIAGWQIVSDNIVILSDPLRLWGAYPKALYYTDSLQLGDSSLIFGMEKGYIPGMPLLVYFFQKTGFMGFQEPVIYFVYIFAVAVCFLPALSKITWKNWGRILFTVLVILGMPLLFYNSYEYIDCGNFYFSLFIDPILGIFMAYILFLLSREKSDGWFYTIQFAVSLGICVMMKDSGIGFAAVAAAVMAVSYIRRKPRYYLAKAAVVSAVPALVYCSWKLMAVLYGLNSHSVKFSLANLIDKEFVVQFIKTMFTVPVMKSNFPSVPYINSFAGVYALILTVSILLAFMLAKEKRRSFLKGLVACVLMEIVFLAGLYVLGLNGWGHRLPSFGRYTATILSGHAGYLCMFLIWSEKKELFGCVKEWMKTGLTVCALCAVILLPATSPDCFNLYPIYEEADSIAANMQEQIQAETDAENFQKVFFVCDGYEYWSSHIHLRAYFDLLGSGVQIGNYVTDSLITETMDQQEFQNVLLEEGYDYVYLLKQSDLLEEQFGSIFEGGDMDGGTLWTVEGPEGKLIQVKR